MQGAARVEFDVGFSLVRERVTIDVPLSWTFDKFYKAVWNKHSAAAEMRGKKLDTLTCNIVDQSVDGSGVILHPMNKDNFKPWLMTERVLFLHCEVSASSKYVVEDLVATFDKDDFDIESPKKIEKSLCCIVC